MKTTVQHSEKPKRNQLLAIYVIAKTIIITTHSLVVVINTIY